MREHFAGILPREILNMDTSDKRPSLRIAEIAITRFRTFHERTVIPLHTRNHADVLAVFHGDNGAGKSNALEALDLFFRALTYWMRWRAGTLLSTDPSLRCEWDAPHPPDGFTPRRRDWPTGSWESMNIEVRFDQEPLGAYRVQLTPSGSDLFLSVGFLVLPKRTLSEVTEDDYSSLSPSASKSLRNLLETPHGPRSRPLFILDEHRRGSWRADDAYQQEALETLSPLLAEKLLSLRLSLEPLERERWRFFGSLLSKFPTLQGKEISIDRVSRDSIPELFFEERGRQILKLTELSSGEQQIVTLCAALITSRASIVAIAEPEMSLSATNQRMLKNILEQQVREGLIDQVILESHVQVFDGPEVVRFRRENGTSRVIREVRKPETEALVAHAREKGAEEQYVTTEGYTQLPAGMRQDLGLEGGGMLWFLRDDRKRWAAWKTEELEELLGANDEPSVES